jgi:hypothetical protein
MSHGAMFDLVGIIPTNATWSEDFYFRENGAGMDISGLTFKLVLREREGDTDDIITLSTTDATLTIVDDDAGVPSILRVLLADQVLNDYEGDVIADLASEDGAGVVKSWAHGVYSLRPNPVAF